MSRRLVVEADGGSRGNPGPAGWGAVVRDARTGALLAERAGYLGFASNNVAEYSGLVAGLEAARDIDPDAHVEARLDSKLVVEQMSGRWQVKHADMRRLSEQARAVLPADHVTYTWVPRAQNAAADALANEAMDAREGVWRDHPEGPASDDDAAPDAAPDDEAARDDAAPDDAVDPQVGPGRPARARRPSGAAMRFDDAEPVTLVLVRHGETPMTETKAYSGGAVPGPSLTSTGRIQAARAADTIFRIGRRLWPDVPHPSALHASPMVRTQETAGAVSRRLGLPVVVDDAFAECDFGEWEGLTAEDIEARWPGDLKRWHVDAAFRAPAGESIEDVGVRVSAGLERLRDGGVDRTVVVVAHSVVIRAAIGSTLGAPSSVWASVRVGPASLTILRLWADGEREVTVVGMPTDI
ncbi:bifunctional RNase H/acid phosphatase [Actinotalea ferrariae]|uniref:bifunctional RNase H/acid phosphatase n=1 Tax=Actinotalea ferrariae TaxID=1386098 RepID=UPI001C8B949C|nr:bifunctional RNase H/acid phosphatase [Actinotalea ferrariae]MBX9243433.1 bifunctional RNase H/acid phosphatase [Actinotalea ferrariae]